MTHHPDILNTFSDDDDDPDTPEYLAALEYYALGWNVISLVRGTKRADCKYAHWHRERQSRADVKMMRNRFLSGGGVAAITGATSGIVVVDTDGPEGERIICEYEAQHGSLPVTRVHRSGSGRGMHRYFCHPCDGRRVKTVANPLIRVDIKGDGGIVVLPPTLHASGERYAVLHDASLAPLPASLIPYIEARAAEVSGKDQRPTSPLVGPPANTLTNNLSRRAPVSRRNVLIVKSMLAALSDRCADDFDTWRDIGFAVHSFDDGPVGLALFRKFSSRCPEKAAVTNFENQWSYFGRPYEGRRITMGTLYALAVQHGWTPIPWDWREEQ